jgi:hypothetical protein
MFQTNDSCLRQNLIRILVQFLHARYEKLVTVENGACWDMLDIDGSGQSWIEIS